MKNKLEKIPVYMPSNTKKKIEELKYEIWNKTGRNMSLSQIIRDMIEEQVEEQRDHIISKYCVVEEDG